ncbi:MAG: energy-coupling factor transporter transmembrane protein EcfT [Clostridia bacterium]|nr:energy-coupling factor transporter transmembrane protein EcfT [Clostridia bacterium]
MSRPSAFRSAHPLVNFISFGLILTLSVCIAHPVCRTLSAVCGAAYYFFLSKKALRYTLRVVLPLSVLTAVLNPMFNHRGATILAYFPSGNPLTAESLIYGAFAGVLLAASLFWFASLTEIMTTDKFVYLFGRVLPSLGLLLSMALRFVPLFHRKFRDAMDVQRASGGGSEKTAARVRRAASAFSMVVTWALENAAQTADSMKGRGYGMRGRTSFSIYRFTPTDAALLCASVLPGAAALLGAVFGQLDFNYYPRFAPAAAPLSSGLFCAAFFVLCLIPLLFDLTEVLLWKRSERRI